MQLEEKVKAIETPTTRNLDWYYHKFPVKKNCLANILSEGIKCAELLNTRGNTYNGRYFISLSKDTGCDCEASAFYSFINNSNIIIEGIKPQKCINLTFLRFLANISLQIRCSGYKDEFQEYKIIDPSKFVGITLPILYYAHCDYYPPLLECKEIIIVMKTLGIELPLYDYSRLQGNFVHSINPDDYLEFYDENIRKLTQEELHILAKSKKK